jgi:hypothetical protein
LGSDKVVRTTHIPNSENLNHNKEMRHMMSRTYQSTIDLIQNIKIQVVSLEENLTKDVSYEIYEKYLLKKNDLINWLEEIEFQIANYV